MFSPKQPILVTLKSIYSISRPPLEHAVAANIYRRTPHRFYLKLRGHKGYMTVDGVEESRMPFYFSENAKGCFSLASNGLLGDAGAFHYVRLTAGGETLLDLDFTKLRSIDELEQYFDCYVFPDLACDEKGDLASVKDYWMLNERGHLVCSGLQTGQVSFGDQGPFFLLTLRHPPIDIFEVEVGFEQSWRRYGVVFGCDKQSFPYYVLPNAYISTGVHGALAFADAHNGACFVRGALIDIEKGTPISRTAATCPQVKSRFVSKEQLSLPRHTLTYHISAPMNYYTEKEVLRATPGSVVYLPPNTPCRLEGDTDAILRIEFDSNHTFPPTLIQPKQPEMLRRMFDEINVIWHTTLANKNYRAMSIFYRIMAEISQPTPEKETADTMRDVLRYIHHHFSEPTLTVKEVAQMSGICESSFYHVFHEACGMTPKAYILNCRLHHACALLRTQEWKIYEVAEKSGFSDVKYFMTAFKREMGVSPGKYQKQHA
ncbi:MAG: helix-turn-helix transcriptional regulator [Clostridia bacterium]|nr:helix-turn-helix transcriptional regulator [Clostridia bacterium]